MQQEWLSVPNLHLLLQYFIRFISKETLHDLLPLAEINFVVMVEELWLVKLFDDVFAVWFDELLITEVVYCPSKEIGDELVENNLVIGVVF